MRSKVSERVFSSTRGKSTPQELSPIAFTPDASPKEDKPGEATPVNLCSSILEEDFMLDSLNDQQNFGVKGREESANKEFMNVLETAIGHFEKDAETKKAKRFPSFSYSNATTGNSLNDKRAEFNTEHEVLKDQYNLLLNKYNDLQLNNKQLMNDYAILRSQYEEVKAVSVWLEKVD
eukprot:TRINITY_DN12415_c0_g2_i1.p1 TRINITY_DN12415_c0_g2~~TRINITY_DN12415_c0_g2_i1.p1  ORF type:complete len:177 (+),score=40.17 TRINITY_DN12415_c0_g2_i1:146-676(+)